MKTAKTNKRTTKAARRRSSELAPLSGSTPKPLAELREIIVRTQIEAARSMEEYYAKDLTHLAAASRGKSCALRALLKDFDRICAAASA